MALACEVEIPEKLHISRVVEAREENFMNFQRGLRSCDGILTSPVSSPNMWTLTQTYTAHAQYPFSTARFFIPLLRAFVFFFSL